MSLNTLREMTFVISLSYNLIKLNRITSPIAIASIMLKIEQVKAEKLTIDYWLV